jgi:hypothetical protein
MYYEALKHAKVKAEMHIYGRTEFAVAAMAGRGRSMAPHNKKF